jgi:citronellol/citronellal dehydrogenase
VLDGRIDILVNNAAAAIYASVLDYPPKRAHLMFEVNVHAPLELAQAVVPGMVERGEGWIVNVSSATARPADGPPFRTSGVTTKIGVYGSTKAALNRITNAFAVELYGRGVRINTVEPRAAVLSEGADALVGGTLRDDQIESMEAMVEAVLALCDCPPERTGGVYVSLDLLDELDRTVMSLDGRSAHPSGQRGA